MVGSGAHLSWFEDTLNISVNLQGGFRRGVLKGATVFLVLLHANDVFLVAYLSK